MEHTNILKGTQILPCPNLQQQRMGYINGASDDATKKTHRPSTSQLAHRLFSAKLIFQLYNVA
jgi:hypothetical protein